ncbi:diguanylate cyclase [Pseudoalteromonas sp.]|uniref:sensor domain-containing diguanylate cyclase n=1 Tax=Pseudoalteromonas sp. TaxID=53249 RepID=UPI002608141E|nr:diguanylate cyclase [Pseudoalteromonas sp.]MCP4586901.1 diguanylate cyclase [Pseudoalteromonas sp.]
MKLRTKFIAVLMLLTLMFMGYMHLFWLDSMKSRVVELVETQYKSHLHTTAEGLVPLLLENQLANVYETLNAHADDNPNWLQLTLTTTSGSRLYPLDEPSLLPSTYNTLTILQDVGFLDPPLARLSVVIDISPSVKVIDDLEYDLGIAFSLIMLCFLLGICLEIELFVRRPLNRLVKASGALMKGNYKYPIQKSQNDEIGELTNYFIEMREALHDHHINLKEEIHQHKNKADKLATLKEESDYQAAHDPLTGLINRRKFEELLHEAFLRVIKDSERHVLLYLDLDRFKKVNDSCGHEAGDKLLKEVVTLIQGSIREHDVFARLGGDEFALILRDCSHNGAVKVGNKIIDEVERYKFYWEGQFFSIGVSIGASDFEYDIEDEKKWLNRADMACYMAKGAGRGCLKSYEPEVV